MSVDTSAREVRHLAEMLRRDARATRSASKAAAAHHDQVIVEACEESAQRLDRAACTLIALLEARDGAR